MADAEEEVIPQTLQQKLLFYTTAFFVLLGTFSLFAFLFLVPFVIDPAFTTIFMQFDTHPAWCVTIEKETLIGATNCTWSSCREGCTKELFKCTHVRVNYKLVPPLAAPTELIAGASEDAGEEAGEEGNATDAGAGAGWGTSRAGTTPRPARAAANASSAAVATTTTAPPAARAPRAIRDYDYLEEDIRKEELEEAANLLEEEPQGLQGNDSEWYYVGAKLYPNVKGCGYPPMLECAVFFDMYGSVGSNFSCYYSKVDPGLVISELDMHQVYMNLVYAMAIPIPSFIVSVIYLTFAYFVIYNEDEEGQEGLVGTDAGEGEGGDGTGKGTGSPLPKDLTASDGIASDAFREGLLQSSSPPPFGQGLRVAMADEKSSESVMTAASDAAAASPPVPPSASIPGNLSKTMTTSISTPPGPIAEV